jgi:DNA-binding transcriptional LysR family regulator
MLDARQLRYFIAVAEELSFAGAADRLNVAQSAVSLQIKGLEEAFGARLLERAQAILAALRRVVEVAQRGEREAVVDARIDLDLAS